MSRMQAHRDPWSAGRPPVRSFRAAHRFFSFNPVAITAALTFTVAGSIQNGRAQNIVESPTSPHTAGFELPEGARPNARDPERAFNPGTGQDLILDSGSQKWIDAKTGQVVGSARSVFFGPPKGAKWDGDNLEKAINPQNGRKFVWDASIQKWIDTKTDRAFNPVYIDREGKAVKNFALSSVSSGRSLPVVTPPAEFETGAKGSFAENFGYYFNEIAKSVNGGIQVYTGRDAFRALLAGELAGTTKFAAQDDGIKSLLAPVHARFATAQTGSPFQVTPALSADFPMADVYQSWWTARDGKLVSGFLAGTTVGLKFAPDLPIAEKWHWLGYTATGNLTFSFSDIRLKRDVVELVRLDNGIGLYRYRYRWSDQLYVGVIAQQVAEIVPDAVVRGADGYLRVDYVRLGLKLQTWDEWTTGERYHPPPTVADSFNGLKHGGAHVYVAANYLRGRRSSYRRILVTEGVRRQRLELAI
jgi:hypothetical protein